VSTSLRRADTSRFERPDTARLRERIVGVFSNALHRDVPSDDIDLFEAGLLDSLAFVDLLLQLEREFGVRTSVEDLEVENFSSIARIADFVSARAAESVEPKVVNFRRGQ
jgi:D-alanine--poly(phosphoribitol) ligase subunit 2